MAFKVEKTNAVRGEIEINGKKYTFTAYPITLSVRKLFIEAEEKEDQLLLFEALEKYFDECIDFDKQMFKDVKEEVRKELERSDKFFDFIDYAMKEVGKQIQSAQKE